MPMPKIDPDALYTEEQAAKKLMQVDRSLTFDEALREIHMAIRVGRLRPIGYFDRK
jgi:hypothetical protein